MARTLIERSESLGRIPRNITADEGARKLKEVGYELTRTHGGHRVFKKGDTVITLGNSGKLSSWHTQLVYRACAREEALYVGKAIDTLPLTVSFKNQVYAVTGKGAMNYMLLDMNNGRQFSAPTWDCLPIEVEVSTTPELKIIPEEDAEQVLEKVDPEPEPEVEELTPQPLALSVPEAPLRASALGTYNANQRDEWIRLTGRLIDGLNVRAEQLTAELVSVEEERDCLQLALDTFAGRPKSQVSEPKRTVLAPTYGPSERKPGKRGGARRLGQSETVKDAILKAYEEDPTVAPNRIAEKVGFSTSYIYKLTRELKAEGRLI